ncbi:BTB/POZ domain-containing protein FBL11 isoform X1 [Prunus yedoensis var. nudiflora]|uniref:BTB/POZ domain-containing protein FBL11 isoform X1 n=1 Tax=Prunus yedoensis var. nudiflora TaxID=2094558 RepID=A0A314UPW0_PRUYE|nr:BTB/POZ domain-containing protein FBL11 isoform X1 [Prunus yedoensis var. nudiflora]
MASSTSEDDFITVVCSNPNPIQANTTSTDIEILISVTNIPSWDLPSILCHQNSQSSSPSEQVRGGLSFSHSFSVCFPGKYNAGESISIFACRLIQHSSYFNGLLSGSFSESGLDCIAIKWNLEAFLHILNCIYDCPLDVTSNNFLPLYEGALYFGVEMLLMRCKTWFSEVVSAEVPPQVPLDDLISIWSFGLEHGEND